MRRSVREELQVHVGDRRQVVWRAVVAVVLVVEIAGDPESEEVDGGPGDDLVRTQADREDRMHEREQRSRKEADEDASDPGAGLVRAVGAEVGAHEHHSFQADVHDAAALGEHAADRGEGQRRRVPEGGRDQGRPDEDTFQVRRGGPHREESAGDADEAEHNRDPADACLSAGDRPDPGCGPEDPDGNRRRHRSHAERRQRQRERQDAERDAANADRLRRRRLRPRGTLQLFGADAHACSAPLRWDSRTFLRACQR